MPLNQDDKQQLLNKVMSTAGLPVTAPDRLAACEIGMRQTLEVIAGLVSLDDPVEEVIEGAKNSAACSVQSEQSAGNGSSVSQRPG